jgi:hypoxia up-regulated 1
VFYLHCHHLIHFHGRLHLERYNITGITEFAAEMKAKELGVPKIALQFELSNSGITRLVKAEAAVEEIITVVEEEEVDDDDAEADVEEKKEGDEEKKEGDKEKKDEAAEGEEKKENATKKEKKADKKKKKKTIMVEKVSAQRHQDHTHHMKNN